MQQQALPIKVNELFKLSNLGLNLDLFKFGNLTLESEKYICVKDGAVSLHIMIGRTINLYHLIYRNVSLSTPQRATLLTESQ